VPTLYICKKCDKPKAKKVEGTPKKGKKLLKALATEDLSFEVVPCKCLGKCKQGPNGLLMPGKQRVHRLTVEKVTGLSHHFVKTD
jgi:NADH:ubiquinone oxidoreductase subunit E